MLLFLLFDVCHIINNNLKGQTQTGDKTMSPDEIKKALTDRNLAEVGRRLMITRSYLQAIRSGKVPLSREMHERLQNYFAGHGV